MSTRLALALLTGVISAAALYPLLRAFQLFTTSEPNPATVIWSAHAGFLWRAWTCVFAGGMAAFAGYVAAREPVRLARALTMLVVVAGALVLAQGLLLP